MKMYHYTESGLDNIYLVNGFTLDKDGTLFIEDIHGLHKFIAESLVYLARKLKGREIRYIRHYLDLSQKVFGEMLGVDYQTVHRWETGKSRITKMADRFIRVILQEYLDPESKARDVIDRLSDLDNDRGKDTKLELSHKRDKWKEAV
jgi:DNA-binding transcriptional regulator YiaG